MLQDRSYRVSVEAIDWKRMFLFLNIVRSFRMAIHPAKMLLAVFMVIIIYLSGLGLDELFNSNAFQLTVQRELAAFKQLIFSAASLDIGFYSFMADSAPARSGVIGALFEMIIGIPSWLYNDHPLFLAIFLSWAFILNIIFGGSITRLAALQSTRNLVPSSFVGLRYIQKNFISFLLAPIIPLFIVFLIACFMALFGLLFNTSVSGFIGALIFGVFLFCGFLVSLLLIGFAGAANLMFPAIAVDACDSFDTVSRTYNYVMRQPWRFLAYSVFSLFYGAITYLFIALVVFLTLWAAKSFTGFLVFENAFDTILPDPQFGSVPFYTSESAYSSNLQTSVVSVWVKLLIALIPAFAYSFYYCAQTWIYLLIRFHSDGTELNAVVTTPGDDPLDRNLDNPELADKLINETQQKRQKNTGDDATQTS